jgi:hypothetical protein
LNLKCDFLGFNFCFFKFNLYRYSKAVADLVTASVAKPKELDWQAQHQGLGGAVQVESS